MSTTDKLDKAKIAQGLLRLGDKKDVYWNFLSNFCTSGLLSQGPAPISFDANGKAVPGLGREFGGWAKAQGAGPAEAGETAIYELPGKLMLLAESDDSRAVPFSTGGA